MGDQSYSVVDIIEQAENFQIVGFIDKKKINKNTKYPYLGNDNQLKDIYQSGIKYAFPAIGIGDDVNINLREKLYKILKNIGFKIPNLVSKKAILHSGVKLGESNLIMAGTILDYNVKLGSNISVGINCSIGHGVHIKSNSTLAGGIITNGNVIIGKNSFIGMGAVIYKNIGNFCKIMPNSTIMEEIKNNKLVFNDIDNRIFNRK